MASWPSGQAKLCKSFHTGSTPVDASNKLMKVGKAKKWTTDQLVVAVQNSYSIRQVIFKLGLNPAGGNYVHVNRWIKELNLDIKHFKGKGWNKGLVGRKKPRLLLEEILVLDSSFQSYKLKKRLLEAGLKYEKCELCNWAVRSLDGRIPLELDHINGNRYDNRLENLRILCPNCHSLQPTHRSRNRIKFK
jgi:hypothetical protein